MNPILLRLLPCLAIVFAVGCSTFEERFASASKGQGPSRSGPFAGAYSGKWTSARSSAPGGNLRCILTPVAGGDYRADFHATWHGVFSSEHSVVLHTKPAAPHKGGGPAADFEGTSKLKTPIGAGTYLCRGTVDMRTMRACYDATYDRGTMELTRIRPQAAGR